MKLKKKSRLNEHHAETSGVGQNTAPATLWRRSKETKKNSPNNRNMGTPEFVWAGLNTTNSYGLHIWYGILQSSLKWGSVYVKEKTGWSNVMEKEIPGYTARLSRLYEECRSKNSKHRWHVERFCRIKNNSVTIPLCAKSQAKNVNQLHCFLHAFSKFKVDATNGSLNIKVITFTFMGWSVVKNARELVDERGGDVVGLHGNHRHRGRSKMMVISASCWTKSLLPRNMENCWWRNEINCKWRDHDGEK